MLKAVADGEMSVDDAVSKIKLEPFEDIDFAKIDTHRGVRQGADEVIYGEGKTVEQICKIISHILENGSESVLVTRLSGDKASEISKQITIDYDIRVHKRFGVAEKSVNARNADVIKPCDLVAVVFGGFCRFLGNGNITCTAGSDYNIA